MKKGFLFYSALLLLPFAQVFALDTTFRVVTENIPLTKASSNSPASGEATDYVRRLLAEANIEDFELVFQPWRRAYREANHTPNTLIYPLARTEERESQFQWIIKLLPANYYLFRLAQREDLSLDNVEEAKHARIGVVNYSVYHEHLLKLGFSNIQVVNSSTQNIKKLMLGRIDYFVTSDSGIFPLCKRTGIDCNSLAPAALLDGASSGLYLAAAQNSDLQSLNSLKSAHFRLQVSGEYRRKFAMRFALLDEFRRRWPHIKTKLRKQALTDFH